MNMRVTYIVPARTFFSLINDLLDVAKIESGRMEISPSILQTRECLDSALKFVALRARDRKQELIIDVYRDANLLYADERGVSPDRHQSRFERG